MRILVALPNALQAEGVAHALRDVIPGAQIRLCDKRSLLPCADPANGDVAAAVVSHPWISRATLQTLHRRQPRATLVAYASHEDAAASRALLAANVAAVVFDTASPAIVGAAVHVALCGNVSVHALCLRDPAPASVRRRRVAGLTLTPRQFDVLRLVALAHPNKTIAHALGIGLRTVKGHVAVILRALHVDNRRDAGRHARRWLARHESGAGPSTQRRSVRVPSMEKPIG